MASVTREEMLEGARAAHERLRPWREAHKLARRRFLEEEIPKLFSEVEPDGRQD